MGWEVFPEEHNLNGPAKSYIGRLREHMRLLEGDLATERGKVLLLQAQLAMANIHGWQRILAFCGRMYFIWPDGKINSDSWRVDYPEMQPIGELSAKWDWKFLFGGCGCRSKTELANSMSENL